jgi:hypothetical protein
MVLETWLWLRYWLRGRCTLSSRGRWRRWPRRGWRGRHACSEAAHARVAVAQWQWLVSLEPPAQRGQNGARNMAVAAVLAAWQCAQADRTGTHALRQIAPEWQWLGGSGAYCSIRRLSAVRMVVESWLWLRNWLRGSGSKLIKAKVNPEIHCHCHCATSILFKSPPQKKMGPKFPNQSIQSKKAKIPFVFPSKNTFFLLLKSGNFFFWLTARKPKKSTYELSVLLFFFFFSSPFPIFDP